MFPSAADKLKFPNEQLLDKQSLVYWKSFFMNIAREIIKIFYTIAN